MMMIIIIIHNYIAHYSYCALMFEVNKHTVIIIVYNTHAGYII